MVKGSHQGYTDKHGDGAAADPRIREAVSAKAKANHLPCAAAFVIADALAVAPAKVGRTMDLMGCRLTHCQLGLFGYTPEKKIVKPLAEVAEGLETAIRAAVVDNRLPCRAAWAIANDLGLGKRTVSGACDTLGIKIKPCQLGAF
jgi:hypothetical protein